jgi:Ca2+-binding RTX toxin-like protein
MNKSILVLIIIGTIAATITASNTSEVFAKNKIEGTDEDEDLVGTEDDDTINSKGGNDRNFGESGDDKIKSGDGNDENFGESGDDKLKSGKGNDNNFGGLGDNKMNGGQGNDFLQGRDGADKFQCGSGDNDVVEGFNEEEGDKATGNCEIFLPG